MFIKAFESVRPWLLCIVRDHASLRGNCCLSWKPSDNCKVAVIGQIGTQLGLLSISDGP